MLSMALGRKRSIAICTSGLLHLELRDRSRIDIVEVVEVVGGESMVKGQTYLVILMFVLIFV